MPEFPCFTKVNHHKSYPSISPDRPELTTKDKVVLVTGAGSGIGQATAIAFAQAGARVVVLCGRRTQFLEETKTKIQALGLQTDVVTQVLDVSSQDNVDIVFQAVYKHAGPIDIVINAAGHLSEPASLRDTTVSNFWDSFDVNIKGAFLISRAFLQQCVKKDSKQRVLMILSSFLGHIPASQITTAPASYSISKLASAKLAEFVAMENPDILRAYAIQPGVVETEMSDRSIAIAPPGTRESLTWDDVDLPAHFMLWLASPKGAVVPSGRFLWVNWDVDELEERSQELRDNPNLFSMIMGGWPFDGKS